MMIWLLLFLNLSTVEAETQTHEFCGEGVWTALLSNQESCRVKIGEFCFTPDDWTRWQSMGPSCARIEVQKKRYLQRHTREEKSSLRIKSLSPGATNPRLSVWSILGRRVLSYRMGLSNAWSNRSGGVILKKLILNERDSTHEVRTLRATGFVHVVTFAGIHLYGMMSIIHLVWTHTALTLGFNYRWVAWIANLSLALGFLMAWILSAFRPGFVRPVLLYIFRRVAMNRGIRMDRTRSLFAIAGVELLWIAGNGIVCGDFSDYAPGRVHYVLAVWGGYLALPPGPTTSLKEHFRLSLGSWILTAVWDLVQTGFVALLTPVFSLITIPFCVWVMTPLTFLVLVVGGESLRALENLVHLFFEWVWRILPIDESIVFVSALDLSILASGLMLRQLLRRRLRQFIIVISLGLLFVRFTDPTRVIQLDVGQGDAALILNSDRTADMVDAGSSFALAPIDWLYILRRYEVFEVRHLYVTHFDEDHIGGLRALGQVVPIRNVWLPEHSEQDPRFEPVREWTALHGIKINSSRSPHERLLFPERRGPNGRMQGVCVRLSDGGYYVNLGDAHAPHEEWFQKRRSPCRSRIAVFKVSHHGSKTSSSVSFVRALRGHEAWLSYGALNRFGHPRGEIVERFRKAGFKVRHTAREGALQYPDSGLRALRHRSLWEALVSLLKQAQVNRSESGRGIR